jgi:hypothetical protein
MRISAKKLADRGIATKRSRRAILREHDALVTAGGQLLDAFHIPWLHTDASKVRDYCGNISSKNIRPGSPDITLFLPPFAIAKGIDAKTGEHGRATADQLKEWDRLGKVGFEVRMYHSVDELKSILMEWLKQVDDMARKLESTFAADPTEPF